LNKYSPFPCECSAADEIERLRTALEAAREYIGDDGSFIGPDVDLVLLKIDTALAKDQMK
jgi:hypothetical protein